MSTSDRVINVGASARASDVQAIADVAAMADDRALEIVATPGNVAKRIIPLFEEGSTAAASHPRVLVVGNDLDATVPVAKVGIMPAHFIAGIINGPLSQANSIGLAAKMVAEAYSPAFGNNSSGSTRTDLLYASISYGTLTTTSVRQKPTAGSAPQSTVLTVQQDMLVTLGIIAGVSAANPLASLPADSGSGKSAVYNFGLAAVSIANGFAGGAINQASITPLWDAGWIQPHRVRGFRPASIFGVTALNEHAGYAWNNRFGSDVRYWALFKSLPTTGTGVAAVSVDNHIDWRGRFICGFLAYLGSGSQAAAPETASAIALGSPSMQWFAGMRADGAAAGTLVTPAAYSGAAQVAIDIDASGVLCFHKVAAPVDGTNGDLLALVLFATDRMNSYAF